MPTGLPASVTIRAVIFEELRISSASLASRSLADRLRVFGHDVVDQRGHQIRPHVAAQIAVGDDADDLPARINDADAAEAFRRHLDQRVGHLGPQRLQRHGIAGMHEVAGIFQHRAELAARMQHAEIDRGKAAALQQRDRQRVAQRQQHQRGGGGREVMRTGLAGLRQRQRDIGGLAQGGGRHPPSSRSARCGSAWHR